MSADITEGLPDAPHHRGGEERGYRIAEVTARGRKIGAERIPIGKGLQSRDLSQAQMTVGPVERAVVGKPLRRKRWCGLVGVEFEEE